MHKAEQGRIITIETVSCLHSVNGTLWYDMKIMILCSKHHYTVAIVSFLDSESCFTAVQKECATPPCQGMSQHVTHFYQAFPPRWYCK